MPRTPASKQPRPAKRPASKAKEDPAAEQKSERQELPKVHELIVRAVTEMLTHGGASSDVERLITVAIRHDWRTKFRGSPLADDDERLNKFVSRDFEEWRQELTIYWSRNRRGEPGSFEADCLSPPSRLCFFSVTSRLHIGHYLPATIAIGV